ncbi:MAG: DUF962 domain-containing protein [Rhodospirillaceae bacterium]|nr:DUF962 domain-containing protein [Rhodospirillaceae bacterium]
MSERIAEYSAFWLHYLREHARPLTRGLHYIGTGLVCVFLVIGLIADVTYLIAVPIAGYGFAWSAHFFVEKNKPATFTYPIWSLYSDFRMFWLFLTEELRAHLDAAGAA